MKRLFLSCVFAGFALLALPLAGVECGGGATAELQADGAYRITFPKSDSWPNVKFAVPDQEWGKGKVAFTVKVVSPGTPAAITVLSDAPRGAIEPRYVNRELRGATPVRLEFAQKGNQKPGYLMITAKTPGTETVIEVTKLEFGQTAPPEPGNAALAASMPVPEADCGGGATGVSQADGSYRITFPKGEGWPNVKFAVPDQEWGKGKVAFTVKVVSPGTPAAITVLSDAPRGAIEPRYVNRELRGKTPVRLEFAHKGTQKPGYLMITAKSPSAETVIEISKLEIGQKAPLAPSAPASEAAGQKAPQEPGNASLAASMPVPEADCGGGATGASQADGSYRITFPKGEGWPNARFAIPNQEWGKGKVALTVKVVSPGAPAPITVLSNSPHGAIESRYVNRELRGATPVRLEFAQKGNQKPGYLMITAKSPSTETVIEITKLEIGQKPLPKLNKTRREPLKPVTFKGKPFFPLGAFDCAPIDALGRIGVIDPDFLAAGGNMTEFGGLHLESAQYFSVHGQPAIFAALEKIKDDPAWDNMALVIETGIEFFMRPGTPDEVKAGIPWVPLDGEAREKALARYEAEVKKLAKYPNVLGYTVDEPENCFHAWYSRARKEDWAANKDTGLVGAIEASFLPLQDIIHANHPGAYTMPILAWWTTYRDAGKMYDIVIANEYPQNSKTSDAEFASNLFIVNYDAGMVVAGARANGKTAIYMPPAFDNCPPYHYCTLREQLYVMFAPITRGVMGLHCWRLNRASDFHRKAVVYPAMKEVSKLQDFLLGEWCDELVQSDHDTASVDYLQSFAERSAMMEKVESGEFRKVDNPVPDVSYCLRKAADGRYCLIAVNNRREPLEVKFTLAVSRLPGLMVDNINRSDRIHVGGNSEFTMKFAPFGVHAYVW